MAQQPGMEVPSLSVSQQIADDFGINHRKKRPRTNGDLFDILDGGNHGGDRDTRMDEDGEGMYDASLPDDLPSLHAAMFPPSAGLNQSIDFTSTTFLGSDAMDTDPLKLSGAFLNSSSNFSAPTATLFDARVKFDPGIALPNQHSMFASQSSSSGRVILTANMDPAQQAIQFLQSSVLDAMQSPDSSTMDTSPFSPSQSQIGFSQHHGAVVAIIPSDSVVPQDRNLLSDHKRVILELRVRPRQFGLLLRSVTLHYHFLMHSRHH
jgi:hypothetical protein